MKNYPNRITKCLECGMDIEIKYPKEDLVVTCKECGAIHIVELCYTLKQTGAFK